MTPFEIKHLFPGFDPASISFLHVLDRFHEGITIVNDRGVVLYMNESQARIDDFVIEEIIGEKITRLYRLDGGNSPTMECLKTGKALNNFASFYRTHMGRVVNAIHNIYPIMADDRVIGSICYISDYRNIEHIFDTVIKPQLPHPVATYGASRPLDKIRNNTNRTHFSFTDIIGRAPELRSAINAAKLSSDSVSPILIFGETGTGKELFAQSIHNRSPRKNHPYLAINCATIPETLLEGMLFGTSAGAFTGAIDKAGLLEKATGGTLLLDEINSMPLNLQAKLLRFLQERKVRRIGSMKEIDVDLKIISAINVSPQQAIKAGTLRADLFYRLAVVFIHIPPLARRKGDLSLLISHFLERKNNQLGMHVIGISMEVMEFFERYEWPGNVRELEHILEGAMNLMGTEKVIEMRHLSLPFHVTSRQDAAAIEFQDPDTKKRDPVNILMASSPPGPLQQRKTLAEIKRSQESAAIIAALRDTRGNAARAARHLGISPQSMNYRLRRLKINRKDYI